MEARYRPELIAELIEEGNAGLREDITPPTPKADAETSGGTNDDA